MKKAVSILLLLAVCFTIATHSVSAASHSIQIEYRKASDFVSKIDFDYLLSSSELGDDIVADIKRIQHYTSSHANYTFNDLNKLIERAEASESTRSDTKYDYSAHLPTSKVELNAKEKVVFNSSPIYGLSVLIQAHYANLQEKSSFGSNTLATNGDAFRHAVWNALGAFYTSESYMERFATAHENLSSDYGPYDIDTEMDLKNNAGGRESVRNMTLPNNPTNGAVHQFLISNNIAAATKNDRLVRFAVRGVQYNTLRPTDSVTTN